MKNFLIGWVIWQIAIIGVMGMVMDLNRSDESRTIDCSTAGYVAAMVFIDVSIPLIQFSNLAARDCTPGTM